MSTSIKLDGKLDTVASLKLAADLQEKRGSDVVLDASDVTQFGAHAVQTIMVAAHSWTADGKSLTFAEMSEEAVEQIETLGISRSQLETAGSSS